MFGHKVPDSSSITVNIKIAIGAGRPLIAWSGSPSTKDAEIVADLSIKPIVRRYLDKHIKSGRLKRDDNGSVTFPAYLVVIDEETGTTDEYKIEITVYESDELAALTANPETQALFLAMSESLDRIQQSNAESIRSIHAEFQSTLKATVESVPKIIASSSQIIAASNPVTLEQLRTITDMAKAETARANDATEAAFTLMKESDGKKDIGLDDVIKAIAATPELINAVHKLLTLLRT